jgi:hypothetical protein
MLQSSNLFLHFRWAHTDKCWADYGLTYCVDRVVDEKQARTAWPAGGGGNFADITLGVVVQQATGTLMAFQPQYLHGTTRLCGAHNRMCTITFSSHIAEAFKIAAEGTKVDSGAGAGEGNVTD